MEMKFFEKNQIFAFLASLSCTLVLGFFVWIAFLSSNNYSFIFNKVLGQANKIGYKFFSATVSLPNTQVEEIVQETDSAQDIVPNEIASSPEAPRNDETTGQERQNLLDDIAEKLDVIQQKVDELVAESKTADELKMEEEIKKDEEKNTVVCAGQININTASAEELDKMAQVGPVTAQKIIQARPFYSLNDLLRVGGIGEITLRKIIEQGCAYVEFVTPAVAPAQVVYPKILISEAQILPINQRFVELYNSNSTDIDLTNWYLQRKTATGEDYSSFVTKNDFAGKIILANSYFLISRQIENADILQEIILSDNNSLVLKNPAGDTSDIMDTASPSSGQSLCLLDAWEVCSPTPKASNAVFTEPTPPSSDSTSPDPDVILPSIVIYEVIDMGGEFSIDLAFSEKVKYEIIIEFGETEIKKWSGEAKNPQPKIWDGKDSSGTIVPDGVYTIKIEITDYTPEKNFVTDTSKTIIIDNSPNLDSGDYNQ